MLSLASVGGLRASRAEGAWRVQARKYTNNFPNGQFRALFFRPFVGHSGKRSMSAPRSVANMFPYRFPAPVVPGSVAARPAVPSGPASSFPFRSPPSRSFLPRSSPPRSFRTVRFAPFVSHRSVRTVRFALRSSDDLFPALGRVLPETTRSRPKLSDKPSYGGSRAPARPRRRRSSQLLGDYFRPPLVAPHRALPGLGTSAGFKTSYLGLFRHLGRAGNP